MAGRLEQVIARSGGAGEVVGPRDAWQAAVIVTDRFGRSDDGALLRSARLGVNWVRLRFLAPAVVDRDRTAVIGVGGMRPAPLVVCGVVAGLVAPAIPKPLRVAMVVSAAGVAVHRHRARRMLWVWRGLRRHQPDALLAGEFAASAPGAGLAFATALVASLGPHTAMAATVQGPPGARRGRAQVRMYERRLGFAVVEREVFGGYELVLLTRPRGPLAVRTDGQNGQSAEQVDVAGRPANRSDIHVIKSVRDASRTV